MDDQLQQKNKQIKNTMVAIEKSEILEPIKQMPNRDRLEIIEFALTLLRENINRTEKLSLRDAAEVMRPFYSEGSSLNQFVDTDTEDFYEHQEYA
jgi:hypothetical protein